MDDSKGKKDLRDRSEKSKRDTKGSEQEEEPDVAERDVQSALRHRSIPRYR